jgi:peptidase E
MTFRLINLTTLLFVMFPISSVQSSYKAIFISSLSNLASEAFTSLVREQITNTSSLSSFVYIPTAKFGYDTSSPKSKGEQRRRARYDAKQKMLLIADSFKLSNPTLLELDASSATPESIASVISNANVIYVDGGNTFYLQKHLLSTKFWSAARPCLERGCLYIGASAGGISAAKSITTAYWKGWDNPSVATEMEWNETALAGAGLADFSLFMHYDEEQYDSLVKQKKAELDHKLITVSNNEFVLLDGETQKSIKYRLCDGKLASIEV